MGFIDCDAHVWETDATWDYLDASERRFRPGVFVLSDSGNGEPRRFWGAFDQRTFRGDGVGPMQPELDAQLFPPGTKSLADVPARLRAMDALAVDVQVLFPTFWLVVDIADPI